MIVEGALAEPPSFLSVRQKEIWHDSLANAPRGVLARIDMGIFLTWVEAYDRFERSMKAQNEMDAGGGPPFLARAGENSTTLVQSPYLGIMNTAAKNMHAAASQLGFTPTARPRLAGQTGEVYDPPPIDRRSEPSAPKARETLDNFLARMPNGPPGKEQVN